MTHVSGCCGTAGELDIFVTLCMKVTTRALCDTKALARDFVTRRLLGGACMFCVQNISEVAIESSLASQILGSMQGPRLLGHAAA